MTAGHTGRFDFEGPPDGDAEPRRAETWRVAAAARALIDRLVATTAPLEALEAAARQVEAAAAELEGWTAPRRYEGFAESVLAGEAPADSAAARSHFDHSPVIGLANPLAPPLRLEARHGKVRGSARFGVAYEGPPGAVHGGYLACAFDEVLGMTQSLGGRPGMTGTLTVRYRRPTPLHTDLRFEGTLDGVDGRKLFCSGRCYDGDTLTAEAEAVFISVDFARIAEMMARRDEAD